MAAPSLPLSALPNNWLSSSLLGSFLYGNATKRNQLAANAPGITLTGAGLDDTYIVYNPTNKVIEGANGGIDTVVTWGSGFTLSNNVENLTLMGGANATAIGNSGDNLIIGNAGNNRIVTGGGNDVLVSGTGTNSFLPTRDYASTTWITNFKTSGATLDKIDLYNYGFNGFAEVQAAMTQIGTDVRIDLGGEQSVMIENKQISAITASNFNVERSMAGLHLTFSDEFSNPLSLNTGAAGTEGNRWKTTFFHGDRTLPANQEEQIYVDPDFKGTSGQPLGLNPYTVSDGILTISARPAAESVQPYLSGFDYTSGVLTTQTSFTQQYGYFEVRAQTPAGQGLWPGFWMLSATGEWPPEIDILEAIGSETNYLSQAVHFGPGHNVLLRGTTVEADMSAAFHTYGMEWTAQNITFYFDGRQTFQIATPDDLHRPMYMVLQLAVGGSWPGSPDETTNWSEADFKVDYVRAYSRDPLAAPAPQVVLSNGVNPLDLSDSFAAAATGPGSTTTYNAGQLQLAGMDSKATVSVTYDADSGLTVTNKGIWNGVKNAMVTSDSNGNVTVNNFVDVQIELGHGVNNVNVTKAKRGSIVTGDADDRITVSAYSNQTIDNVMSIAAGNGNNDVSFTGASNTRTAIVTGNGKDQITIAGDAHSVIDAGAGDDQIAIDSTRSATITGGAGHDLFEFIAGAHASITDFDAAEDTILLKGVSASSVQITAQGGNTLLDLGGGSSVSLTGVTLQPGGINLVFA